MTRKNRQSVTAKHRTDGAPRRRLPPPSLQDPFRLAVPVARDGYRIAVGYPVGEYGPPGHWGIRRFIPYRELCAEADQTPFLHAIPSLWHLPRTAYDPMDGKTLLDEFVATDLSSGPHRYDPLLAFARRHGLPAGFIRFPDRTILEGDTFFTTDYALLLRMCESDTWIPRIEDLLFGFALDAWLNLRKSLAMAQAALLGKTTQLAGPTESAFASFRKTRRHYDEPTDRLAAARAEAALSINAALADHVRARWDPHTNRALLCPLDLAGALWLRLAQETRQPGPAAIKCRNPGCHRLFQPPHGRTLFCSDKCRKAYDALRKKEKRSQCRPRKGEPATGLDTVHPILSRILDELARQPTRDDVPTADAPRAREMIRRPRRHTTTDQ